MDRRDARLRTGIVEWFRHVAPAWQVTVVEPTFQSGVVVYVRYDDPWTGQAHEVQRIIEQGPWLTAEQTVRELQTVHGQMRDWVAIVEECLARGEAPPRTPEERERYAADVLLGRPVSPLSPETRVLLDRFYRDRQLMMTGVFPYPVPPPPTPES